MSTANKHKRIFEGITTDEAVAEEESVLLEKQRLLDYKNVFINEIWGKIETNDIEVISFISNLFPNESFPHCAKAECHLCKRTVAVLDKKFTDFTPPECVVEHEVMNWTYGGKIFYKRNREFGDNAYIGRCIHCNKTFRAEGYDQVEDVEHWVKGHCYQGCHIMDKTVANGVWEEIKTDNRSICESDCDEYDNYEDHEGSFGEDENQYEDEDEEDENEDEDEDDWNDI